MKTIYLAGGCLWGTQAFLKNIKGVVSTRAGRTTEDNPTGYVESVRVEYDMDLKDLLSKFWETINPYNKHGQGMDIGSKYLPGIYCTDKEQLEVATKFIEDNDIDNSRQMVAKAVMFTSFKDSAEEHQDYLDKNPGGYCHIPQALIDKYK